MNIIAHNLKIAVRNLMKYKLQSLICIMSIAIGIVTLSFTHSILTRVRLPSICNEDYYTRAYEVSFKSVSNGEKVNISTDIIRAIKKEGGPKSAEKIVLPNAHLTGITAEFHFTDSTVRKGGVMGQVIDPEYPEYAAIRSAITGKKIKVMKAGEAIISEDFAKKYFQDKNPVGTVQIHTSEAQPIPVTIIDVYEALSVLDPLYNNWQFNFCIADKIEDEYLDNRFYAFRINVVCGEGWSEQELLKEINERVKPLGIVAELSNISKNSGFYNEMVVTIKLVGYFIGALILLAAIIGFLRIESQLFLLRRRELALRIVNGADRLQLFGTLVSELILTLSLSIITALWFGHMLQGFIISKLGLWVSNSGVEINNLWLYSLVIGGVLFMICSVIAWITLMHICKINNDLTTNMHRSRKHLFSNVMLGIQIAISIIFVCSTLILVNGGDKVLKACHIPENDNYYKDWLSLECSYARSPERLLDELSRLPDLDKMGMFGKIYTTFREIEETPEAVERFRNQQYFKTFLVKDTTILSSLGVNIEWLDKVVDRNECLIISKVLYDEFREVGLLDNQTLNFEDMGARLPIAGTFNYMPYEPDNHLLLIVSSIFNNTSWNNLLIPKDGKGKALARSVDETIERLEPEIINQMVTNYRERSNTLLGFVEAIRVGGWILGSVSMLICAMSVFSSIALDTRARKKEVAIRKVNGAKSNDIYRMFGRIYIVLIIISMLIAVPVCGWFNLAVEAIVKDTSPEIILSPVTPIIFGSGMVILVIFLIVGCQIHKVMQTDPSKIIAKE